MSFEVDVLNPFRPWEAKKILVCSLLCETSSLVKRKEISVFCGRGREGGCGRTALIINSSKIKSTKKKERREKAE